MAVCSPFGYDIDTETSACPNQRFGPII